MWNRISSICSIQEQYARFTVVMRLLYNLIEKFTCTNFLVYLYWNARGFNLFKSSTYCPVLGRIHIWKTQFPILIFLTARMNASVIPTDILKLVM